MFLGNHVDHDIIAYSALLQSDKFGLKRLTNVLCQPTYFEAI